MKKQGLVAIKGLDTLRVKEIVIFERFCKRNGGLVVTIYDYLKKIIIEKGKMEVIY